MDEESHLMFEFRRQSLVDAGYLKPDEVAYVYKDAKAMGLVCMDDQNERFRLATDEEKKAMASESSASV